MEDIVENFGNGAIPTIEQHGSDIQHCSTDRYKSSGVFLVFLVPALGGFLFGYDISATSFAVLQFHYLSALWQGFNVSAASIGAFLGSLWIFQVADQIGRRCELQLGAVLYVIGAIFESIGSAGMGMQHHRSTSLCVLLLGRVVYGMAIACAMHGGPTYIAEMAPAQVRGFLVSMKEASIVAGIAMGYTSGYLFSGSGPGVAYTYGYSVIVSVSMLVLSFRIPRSSRWLLLRENYTEALESLKFVFHEEKAAFELETMKAQRDENIVPTGEVNQCDASQSLWSREFRAPLVAGIGLVVLQQITGQPSILSYTASIFDQVGLSGGSSILVAVFKFLATTIAALSVEEKGRKGLLFIGNSLMLLSLFVLTFTFNSDHGGAIGVLFAMFVYIGGYQVSFGPITWLIISEVFPLSVRGQAVALAVQMNFLCNAIVQFAIPILEQVVGLRATFCVFGVLTGYSLYFIKTRVIETKGLSLEEIERAFDSSSEGYLLVRPAPSGHQRFQDSAAPL